MYCQEYLGQESSYTGAIPATNTGMVTSDTAFLRLTWWLSATTLLSHQISHSISQIGSDLTSLVFRMSIHDSVTHTSASTC